MSVYNLNGLASEERYTLFVLVAIIGRLEYVRRMISLFGFGLVHMLNMINCYRAEIV